MNRIGFRFLVGAFVLLIGASILVDLLFHVAIPLVRVAVALLCIVVGARLVVHAWGAGRDASGEAWLADRRFAPEGALAGDARYDVVFGRGVVDLTHVVPPAADVTVTVDALFGHAVVKIDPAIGYDVDGTAAFGEVRLPDRNATSMGSLHYQPPAGGAPRLHLRVNAVFGACQVVEAPAAA